MDMIKEHESDSPTSEVNEDIFVPESRALDARSVRKVYLITYSQVNEELFTTRRSFVDAVLQFFNDCNVVQWCCSLEQHLSACCSLSQGHQLGPKQTVDFQQEIFTFSPRFNNKAKRRKKRMTNLNL